MRNKKILENHGNDGLRKLKIFNKKTQEQVNQEFTNRQFLRMLPGGNPYFLHNTWIEFCQHQVNVSVQLN